MKRWEVDGTGLSSCPLLDFGISNFETLQSTAKQLSFIHKLFLSNRYWSNITGQVGVQISYFSTVGSG
jgi:hypothetical protein